MRALLPRPNYTEKQDVLKAIESDCERRGRSMPRTFKDVIQAAFEAYNSRSDVFKDGCPDLFYFAGVKGDVSLHELLITLFLFLSAPVTAQMISKAHILRSAETQAQLPETGCDARWATLDRGGPDEVPQLPASPSR